MMRGMLRSPRAGLAVLLSALFLVALGALAGCGDKAAPAPGAPRRITIGLVAKSQSNLSALNTLANLANSQSRA